MLSLRKFMIVLWKNIIYLKRNWFISIVEFIIPLIFFSFILLIHNELQHEKERNSKQKLNINDTDYIKSLLNYQNSELFYTPDTSFTKTIMKRIAKPSGNGLLNAVAFTTEKEMEQPFLINNAERRYGIVFKSDESSLNFNYKISSKVSPPIKNQYLNSTNVLKQSANYDDKILPILQLALDVAYIQHVSGVSTPYEVTLEEFSEAEKSITDALHFGPISTLYITVVPSLIPFSFIILCPSLIKKMVEEKQTGLKELMKMVGLKNWMIWTGWMVHTLAIYSFSCAFVTVMMCVEILEIGPIFKYTHWSVVFILFLLFCAACVSFSFVISAFFHRPTIAVIVGVVLWVILLNSLIPFKPKSWIVKMVIGMVPTMSVVYGIRIMTVFQRRKEVLSWTNLFSDGIEDREDISMGLLYLTLMFSIFLYTVIATCVDAAFPGPFGRPKSIFLFQMCSKRVKKASFFENKEEDKQNIIIEPPPVGYKVGIRISNLMKKFGPNLVAVNNVNLDIYEGQITALLGHNGAGKTTTMSILTGMIPPSSGAIFYNEMNIFEDMEKFQQNIGLCTQHNLLFSYLTVIEHLILFGMLKGFSFSEAKKEGFRVLNVMNMTDEKSAMVEKMSGGTKRKLCLAIALIGNPQILILDEPTSGMDPESRRELWDFLLSLRRKHTIIITTHFMEEADVLGDRIAIMDHGRVYCCGSTLFLKKTYGAGYKLTLEITPKADVHRITMFIQDYLKEAQLKSSTKHELTYTLPQGRTSDFPEFFRNLEKSISHINVKNISVACTTMEDVFMKVGEMTMGESMDVQRPVSIRPSQVVFSQKFRGMNLLLRQFLKLLYKKVLYTRRNWFGTFIFILFPVTMLLLQLCTTKTNTDDFEPPVPISLQPYKEISTNFGLNSSEQTLPNMYNSNIVLGLMKHMKKNITMGGELDSKSAKQLFSNTTVHVPPIAVNLIRQSLLQNTLFTSISTITISTLPPSMNDKCNPIAIKSTSLEISILWLLGISIGLLVLISHFIPFPLMERVCNIKRIQYMTGIPPIFYWLSCFMVDYFLYIIIGTVVMVGVILVADSNEIFSNYKALGLFALIVFLFGLSGGIYAYFYSFCTNTPHFSMFVFITVNLLIGTVPSAIIYILKVLNIIENPLIAVLLNNIFSLNPYFAMSNAFGYFAKISAMMKYCKDCPDILPECNDLDYYKYKDESVAMYITYLLWDWLLYLSLILLIDHGYVELVCHYFKGKMMGKQVVSPDIGDQDVKKEKFEAESATFIRGSNNVVLTTKNLVKRFNRKVTAVNGISFKICAGDCFGLLGTNGAGKTTTFRLLAGDLLPTDGDAKILDKTLSTNRTKFLSEIGYCPQVDSINDLLTGEELLSIFASLRGIPSKMIPSEINECIRLLGLEEYRHRLCGHYSGGNKRKLCTGIALIGDPRVILLDEPTSGVDPVSRRSLWKVLTQCQKLGQCIVLSSHSMEECEAICTRLTIILKGQMVCIGSPQHLKRIYGLGYTIMIKLSNQLDVETAVQALKNNMNTSFSFKCSIIEESMHLINYHVVDTTLPLSTIFNTMEHITNKHNIVEEYFVSDTTLEQVFLLLAKN